MDILTIILIVAGLVLFETITSIDNAIINAEVLSTMGERARRWFLIWGLLFAVFAIRGLLPWLIVWLSTPALGPVGALTATFSSDPLVIAAIEQSAPILLAAIVWFALDKNPMMAFGAVVGSTAFFIVLGFRQNAEQAEHKMLHDSGMSDVSKIFYLEVIDATFSIDGVIGAFAFTMAVPLILLGNGIGAFVVRELTIRNVDKIRNYKYLKNGAMYSILFLGTIMILDSFGVHIPFWVSPLITFGVVGYFLWKSIREIPKAPGEQKAA